MCGAYQTQIFTHSLNKSATDFLMGGAAGILGWAGIKGIAFSLLIALFLLGRDAGPGSTGMAAGSIGRAPEYRPSRA